MSQPFAARPDRDDRSRADGQCSTAIASRTPPTSPCSWLAHSRWRRCAAAPALRWHAALDRQRTATCREAGIRFPSSVLRAKVEKGREPRAQTVVSFSADPPVRAARSRSGSARPRGARDGRCATPPRISGRPIRSRSASRSRTAARRRLHRREFRGRARKHRCDDSTRDPKEVKKMQAEGPSADLVAKEQRKGRAATMKRRFGRTATG